MELSIRVPPHFICAQHAGNQFTVEVDPNRTQHESSVIEAAKRALSSGETLVHRGVAFGQDSAPAERRNREQVSYQEVRAAAWQPPRRASTPAVLKRREGLAEKPEEIGTAPAAARNHAHATIADQETASF